VKGLWNEKDVIWEGINSNMNILVGINGSGKTTLMNLMYAYYCDDKSLKKMTWEDVHAIPAANQWEQPEIVYIRNLDVPTRRKDESPLLQELENAVYQNKKSVSFFSYRMKMIDYPEHYEEIKENINRFQQLISQMFAETGKQMVVKDSQLTFSTPRGNICDLKDLSSGEKQLLLILLRVFLLEKKPAIIFMDEPEISLHIGWQQQLLDVLVKLNPNAQFFITTHSPSMFGRGWGDKVVYMEDIIKPAF
jgi:predicted ATP-dependent endonuclease of OLD family